MKNVTISVDDETYRRARIKAAEQGTSVSSIVRDYLKVLSADVGERAGGFAEAPANEFERLKALEAEVRQRLGYYSAASRRKRDELYDRDET